MRLLSVSGLLVACLAVDGCSVETTPPPARARATVPASLDLGSGAARVHVRFEPFGLKVTDAGGETLLDTIDVDPRVAGDAAHAYGPIGATHHETNFETVLIEGWDHVTGSDTPWLHATAVARLESTDHSASLDLFDPTDATRAATTLHLDLAVDGAEVRLDATVVDAPRMATPSGFGAGLNEMGLSFAIADDERFYGLGERNVTVDHRGQHYECWTEEGGIGGGEGRAPGVDNPSPNGLGMTHVPVPFVLSSRGWGMWQQTTFRTGFAMGSDAAGALRVYAEEPALHLRLFAHRDPKDTLADYTRLSGRPTRPAPWVFGPRRRVDHGSMVGGEPEEQALRTHHVPTTGVDDATHFLPTNASNGREAELAAWTTSMHALGFKAIGYFNSYVSLTDPNAKPLVDEGRARDVFVRLDSGAEFDTFMVSAGGQQVATIDLTNPAGVAWFQSLQSQALDLGYDGWMLDFGEYLPQRARMFDGRSGWEMHDAYPVLYQRVTAELMRRKRGDDWMYFARSGGAGTQAYAPIVWSGDPDGSFDEAKGLPAQLRGGINAGLSGIAFWGSDISGYTCLNDPPPDKELYLRWAEVGALSSDMHDENACAQKPKEAPAKWNLWSDDETTRVYARYASLHTRLNPYLMIAAQQAVDLGLPVIRHPLLMDPQSAEAWAVTGEYYFGDALYVAPVVHRGESTRSTWLPPGTWFDWWSLRPSAGGGTVTRDAPLDLLPIWLKSGQIVPMLDPAVETLAPHTRPEVVGVADRADVLDVRAGIDAATREGDTTLVDGTTLYVADSGAAPKLPDGIVAVDDEAKLATCSGCGKLEPVPGSSAIRIRLTTTPTTEGVLAAGGLTLRVGRAPRPLRVRWDVIVAR